MTTSKFSRVLLSLTILASVSLGGCASTPAAEVPVEFGHVHGIVDLGGGEMLLGTHTGIYAITLAGEISGPVGGNDFDAMGIAGNSQVQYSSGHPGPNTPPEFGSPNLGIIRSTDFGVTWTPIAFNGVEDFHVLTTTANNEIFGIGSSSLALRKSLDGGVTWTEGPVIEAASLAVTSMGSLFAATPSGLQVSLDQGTSFSTVTGAPTLYYLAAGQNGGLIGVDVDGTLWRQDDTQWQRFGAASGPVVALVETYTGDVVLVDDRGVVLLSDDRVDVIHEMSMNH